MPTSNSQTSLSPGPSSDAASTVEQEENTAVQSDDQDITIIQFTGYIPGWIGTARGMKESKQVPKKLNPTLNLKAGKRYEIRWTNGDGVGHSFIITNKSGKWIAGTDLAFGTGTTKTVRFTATPEMAQYYCTVHPHQMVGKIKVSGQTDKGPGVKPPKDISPVKKKSSVTFNKQKSDGKTVIVKSTTLPEGGFVTIHSERLMKRDKTARDVKKSVLGWSKFLEPGTHKNVTVKLNKQLKPELKPAKLLIAMNHRDTNGNKQYDFVGSGDSFADADWPYFTPKGRAVVDPDAVEVTGNGGGQ